MAPGCPQFGSLLSPQYWSDYGELKPVSILIRDAVLLWVRMNYLHPGGRGFGMELDDSLHGCNSPYFMQIQKNYTFSFPLPARSMPGGALGSLETVIPQHPREF